MVEEKSDALHLKELNDGFREQKNGKSFQDRFLCERGTYIYGSCTVQ
jgi:hypothetical protein